jgi:hypothetical protein
MAFHYKTGHKLIQYSDVDFIQWGSEYQTSPVFEWSISAGTLHFNTGSLYKTGPDYNGPLLNQTNFTLRGHKIFYDQLLRLVY